jgi:hypothetical protein
LIFFEGIISGCLFTILIFTLIVLLIVCLKIRYIQGKYLYKNSINPHEIEKEKACHSIDSSSATIPIRSYFNYLQFCYSHHSFDVKPKINFQQEIISQFKFLIENNDQFIDCLFKNVLQSNDKYILSQLILTQRYNLKKLLKFNHDSIFFNICILTSYDAFSTNRIHLLFSQLYKQLKFKIYNGPIDAIEHTMSYYSLNIDTILHDHSIVFKTIQLIVHVEIQNKNNSDDLLFLLNLTCLTCDTISQVKEKILNQLNSFDRISINECKLYLLTNNSCSTSSSSSTASSSVPLTRKSMLTQLLFNRTIKYSTTTINDSYQNSNVLLLNDVDNTNEQINHWKKLNTLQHYGISTDGYEFKMFIPNRQIDYMDNSTDLSM